MENKHCAGPNCAALDDDTGPPHSSECRAQLQAAIGVRKSPDANTEAVRDLLLERSEFGLKKYGVTTENSRLSIDQWALHAAQESMDHAVYLMAIIRTRQRNLELAKRLTTMRNAMIHCSHPLATNETIQMLGETILALKGVDEE